MLGPPRQALLRYASPLRTASLPLHVLQSAGLTRGKTTSFAESLKDTAYLSCLAAPIKKAPIFLIERFFWLIHCNPRHLTD